MNYILTGTPGAGKTSVLRYLEIVHNFCVVEESATDLIKHLQIDGHNEPWLMEDFIDKLVNLQKHRQLHARQNRLAVFDRSPICTYALCLLLNKKPPSGLIDEIEYILHNGIYAKEVFFFRNLGFCEVTSVRKITYEEALIFEEIHEATYKKFGYQLVYIEADTIPIRAQIVINNVAQDVTRLD